MTPTLNGRIQTRLFLIAFVALPWTIVVVPFLTPLAGAGATVADVYEVAFVALLLVAALGIGWEILYHLLMQLRWEKDWPALFGLLTGVNEFLLLAVVLVALGYSVSLAVLLHFATVWLWVWFVANGPLRAVFPRWRFQGGRII